MEEYKASVQGVDEALARLNATLASYKISGNLPKKSAADLVTGSESLPSSSTEETNAVPKEALGTLKHHIFQVVSKVVSEPVDWETWTSMSDAEALQKYPEVRFRNSYIYLVRPKGSCNVSRFKTMTSDNFSSPFRNCSTWSKNNHTAFLSTWNWQTSTCS